MKRLVVLMALVVAACAKGNVQTIAATSSGPLPRPTEIAVHDFAISPDEVRLDQRMLLNLQSGESPSERQWQAAQTTREALANRLTAKLKDYGLPAMRVPGNMPPSPGMLMVQGQILSVDEGNRRRRMLIGLGAGKSSTAADAQLYYVKQASQPPELLEAFSGSANSGRMPGAAETMGVGAAADRVATSAAATAATQTGGMMRGTAEEMNANDLADALAKKIGAYAAGQGWIPASVVQ